MLKEGVFLQERYEILSRIGSGGMADVYKARDHKLNRNVAVKVLKPEFREDKAFISKFRTEAQSAGGLAHPNIVNVYDVGEDNGVNFIVMELVEGITLKEYIEKKGRLTVREATSIAIQVSMGLDAAHKHQIVHRDVKPQNIIISTDGKVKVTDFGIARAATSNTISSSVMGSVHYSSPEQARGGYSDYKSDIYSLGITMYEMVTGHVPFDGDSTVAIAIKHLQEEIQSPRRYIPDLPYSLEQIILKCTQKSPDRRYNNMEELIRDLKESLVNPEGRFVQIAPIRNTDRTVVISKEDLEKIQEGRGEALQAEEQAADPGYGNYTAGYQPGGVYQQPGSYQQTGSYQQLGGYQQTGSYQQPGGYQQSGAYQQTGDYQSGGYASQPGQGQKYGNDPGYARQGHQETFGKYEEEEEDLHSGFSKFLTIGSVVVGVLILAIVVVLVGNAAGFLNINSIRKVFSGNKQETTAVTETASESETKKETKETTGKLTGETAAAGQIIIPDLRGKTAEEVAAALQEKGISGTNGGNRASNTYPAGQVMGQTPAAGSSVAKGTSVTYYISSGEGTVSVPDVAAIPEADAIAELQAAGLTISSQYYSNEVVPDGYVIYTSPQGGTSVNPGSQVTLFVCKKDNGSSSSSDNQNNQNSQSGGNQAETESQETSADPSGNPDDYSGQNATSAVQALQSEGYTVVTQEVVSADVPYGQVISQSIDGNTITLVISVGSGDPPLTETVETIEDISNTPDTNTVSGADDGKVYVCSQAIDAPKDYKEGEPVKIVVEQNGKKTTLVDGSVVQFPFKINMTSGSGEKGTVTLYILDEDYAEVAKVTYPSITFKEQNG